MSATAIQDADVEALALRLAVSPGPALDELEGRRRSRAAFRRWGEKIPARLDESQDLPLLIHRHGDYWLRSAEGLVRSLDPHGLGSRDFHVVDFATLGIAAPALVGFTFPGDAFFRAVRPRLKRTALPGPVVVVNVRAEAARHTKHGLDSQPERLLQENVRVGLCGTVLHEAAHVVAFQAAGLALPDEVSLDIVRQVVARPVAQDSRVANHGADWVRGFAHLLRRSRPIPSSDFWERVFLFDVAQHHGENAGDLLEALAQELDATSPEDRLVDVLRRPAPDSFLRLIDASTTRDKENA